jgi:hypothetical protein
MEGANPRDWKSVTAGRWTAGDASLRTWRAGPIAMLENAHVSTAERIRIWRARRLERTLNWQTIFELHSAAAELERKAACTPLI